MPTYSIQGPDGKTYSIDGPEGASREQVIDAIQAKLAAPTPQPEHAGILRRVGDIGISALQGVAALPEVATGLADIPTFGVAGKGVEEAEKAIFGGTTKDLRAKLQEYKSEDQKAAEQKVAEAKGFMPTLEEYVKNPSAIADVVAQSAPTMVGGAGIARGILAKAGEKIAPSVAAAIGEGAVTSGQIAEQIRQDSENGLLSPKQAALSTLAGAFTGGLSKFGSIVANKLGTENVETILAGGTMNNAAKQHVLAAAIKGALNESVFEELPQSIQEQVMQNLAENKPWDEGIAQQAAAGLLAGAAMGGPASLLMQAKVNKDIAEQAKPKLLMPPKEEEVTTEEAPKEEVKAEEPKVTNLSNLVNTTKVTPEEIKAEEPKLEKEVKNEPGIIQTVVNEPAVGTSTTVSGESSDGTTAVTTTADRTGLAGATSSVGTTEGRAETKPAPLEDKEKQARRIQLEEANKLFEIRDKEEKENLINEAMAKYGLTREQAERRVNLPPVPKITQEQYDNLHEYLTTESQYGRGAPLNKERGIESAAMEDVFLKRDLRDVKGFEKALTKLAEEKTTAAHEAREAEIQRLINEEGYTETLARGEVGNTNDKYFIGKNKREILNYSKERPYELFNYDTESGKSIEQQYLDLQEEYEGKRKPSKNQLKEAELRKSFRESLSPEDKAKYDQNVKDNLAKEIQLNRQAIEEERKPTKTAEIVEKGKTLTTAPYIEQHGLFAVANHISDRIKELNGKFPTINFGTVPNGRPGMFDPKTNTVTIDRNNLKGVSEDQVLVHEMGHYLLDHIIDNRKVLGAISKEQKNAIFRLENLRKQVVNKLGKNAFDIPTVKEFVSELLSNRDFQHAVASIEGEKYKPKKGLVRKIAEAILDALGLEGLKPVILEESLDLIESIITDKAYRLPTKTMTGKKVSFAPEAKKAEEKPVRDFIQRAKDLAPKEYHKPTITDVVRKTFYGEQAANELVKKFQNDRFPIKTWQKIIEKAGLKRVGGEDFNNIYDHIVLAFGQADLRNKEYLARPSRELRHLVSDYAKAANIPVSEALGHLHQLAEALHEPERRHIKYLQHVPLDLEQNIKLQSGEMTSAAHLRDLIFEVINSQEKLSDTDIKALRNELEKIVKENAMPGKEGNKYHSIDENSAEYNVTAGLDSEDVKQIMDMYSLETYKLRPMMDKVLAALKPIQEATIMLNKQGNYGSNATDNIIRFYDWQHYVPLKGRAESEMPRNSMHLNLDDVRLSTELKEEKNSFEGRQSEAKNSIIQTMVDASLSAARAGRKGLTQSIANAIDQKVLEGKKLATYTAHQLYTKTGIDEELLRKRDVIFNYKDDGSMEVYEIKDPRLLEAIRRTYREGNPLLDKLNALTSAIGQSHTRYNPSFPILNYVRDALTNSFVMMVDKSPKEAFKYLGAIASQVASGGMKKALQVSHLFHTDQIGKLRELAKKDNFVANMLEYIEAGGRVSYVQGLSVRSQLDQLYKDVGQHKIITTKENLDKFFDTYTDTFELSARTAAYGIFKNELKQKGYTDEQAKQLAASYTKQLANFEEVGQYGKALGAMFEFFRPSATGAIRAMESIAPAFRRWTDVKKNLPPNIFGTEGNRTAEQQARLDTYEQNYRKQSRAASAAMISLMGAGATLYLMAAAMGSKDDEERNTVLNDDLSRWTRFARFDIGDGKVIQIPWGFGLGAFAAAGAQMAGAATSPSNSVGDVMGNLISIGLDSFAPIPISRINPLDNFPAFMMDSITPSVAKPFYEYTMNLNSFGQEIYNNRQSRYGDAYTGGDNIPEMYKDAARFLADTTNGAIDWTPNTMYFFANNYADGGFKIAQDLYGMGMVAATDKKFDPTQNAFILQSFIKKQSNVDQREFAKVQQDITDKEKVINMFKTSNPDQYIKYVETHPYDEAKITMFNKLVGSDLKKLQTQANVIRRMTDISPQDRADMLKDNKDSQNLVKYNIVKSMKYFDELESN